jgi:hypothetical protein
LDVAVQLAEPALMLIVNVFVAGFSGRARFLKKLIVVGLTVSVAAFVTLRVTGTTFGVLLAFGDVMVMLAMYVPTANPVLFTETVNVDGAVPEAGLTASQVASSLADQFKTLTGVEIAIDWFGGLGPVRTALKLRLDGFVTMVGRLMLSVTVTCRPQPFGVVIVMRPVWVPFGSPAGLTDTVITEPAVPDVGVIFNQLALSVADQFIVPFPQFEIVSVCAGGALPSGELKARPVGLVQTSAPFTVRLTETLSCAQQLVVLKVAEPKVNPGQNEPGNILSVTKLKPAEPDEGKASIQNGRNGPTCQLSLLLTVMDWFTTDVPNGTLTFKENGETEIDGLVTAATTAFDTTSAKCWSVRSSLEGLPSPARLLARTTTLKSPEDSEGIISDLMRVGPAVASEAGRTSLAIRLAPTIATSRTRSFIRFASLPRASIHASVTRTGSAFDLAEALTSKVSPVRVNRRV